MHSGSKRKKVEIIALCLSSLLALVFLACCFSLWYFCKRRIAKRKLEKEFELPLYDVSTIARATNNFSSQNKLGEGGFGTVYKGALDGGQDIAVKRLSKTSQQGLEEFKNEVICVAKLQHRNLVKLQGCCISGEEKMLIYEYMPNKSLDIFIFDQKKRKLLNWNKRINIIVGIARGLLYLHRDSRQRIIHRDLKASNVLLDLELNPKISDFGLAKNVGVDETADRTKRIAGTHGYISPEYAAHGIFSLKSDVFSFGVLVLEIVSGRKNNYVFDADQDETLLGHAWKLNMEGRAIELVDENIAESCDVAQVIRAIHVGLLCVQQRPEDRPNMSGAVKMLVNDAAVVDLPQPKEPAFFTGSVLAAGVKAELSPANHSTVSMNEVTITSLTPR
ncbi:unnamed protein product [Cuscuta epithymum]|uniref:non-specific serine/threonine protein kinase n=1 Tax=Cuscuta epithymum TaxID=186058 RepID=A0AAV0DNE7_9ASTE|nr:unnamed protein product [Cuscuta epithymum]